MAAAARLPSIEPMVRLMLFVWRPYSLSAEEAVGWMREQAAPLAATGAERVALVRLGAPEFYGDSDCEWLIEMPTGVSRTPPPPRAPFPAATSSQTSGCSACAPN